MIKLSCKKPEKVQRFNNRCTVVTISGTITLSFDSWCGAVPISIIDWARNNSSVHIPELWGDAMEIIVQGKSVTAAGDTFYPVLGARIAESRAKVKLYKFLYTLSNKMFNHFATLAFGCPPEPTDLNQETYSKADCQYGGLEGTRNWYWQLYQEEQRHLTNLLSMA